MAERRSFGVAFYPLRLVPPIPLLGVFPMALSHDSSAAALPPFVARHIGPRDHEIREMLATLGYDSLEALARDVVPQQIRL